MKYIINIATKTFTAAYVQKPHSASAHVICSLQFNNMSIFYNTTVTVQMGKDMYELLYLCLIFYNNPVSVIYILWKPISAT